MKLTSVLVLVAAATVLAVGVGVFAGPDTPTTAPAGSRVLATVGDVTITADRRDALLKGYDLSQVGDKEKAKAQQAALDGAIVRALAHKYFAIHKMTCSEAEMASFKKELADAAAKNNVSVDEFMAAQHMTAEDLPDQAAFAKFAKTAFTKDKIEAFVKANPDYFNGTTVRASHILVSCGMCASSADQAKAKAKIDGIAADIKAGKITFEDAAKKYSDCPSKEKGGDLGDFTFEKMDPPFAKASFAMKVGETSPIIRSSFGFHLIKLTGREQGKDAPGQGAESIVFHVLDSQIKMGFVEMGLKDCPIVIKEAPAAPKDETKAN